MRRLAAILTVVWFSLSLIGPMVLAAGAQSASAACCRRNGQHRCAANQQESGSGVVWRAARCPEFPSAKALPAQRQAIGPAAAPAIFASMASHPAVPSQTQVLCRISHDRSGQKRGPPLFFL
jgi:hypothetical protein